MNTFFKNPFVHGVIAALVLIIPVFILHFPGFADITIGGALTWIASYISKSIA